jgi:hypothetical protein
MAGRTDQQCMGRWRRHLDPRVKRDPWTTKEDRRLAELRVEHGANWSAIAKEMLDRTAQQCRARWFQAHFTGHRYLRPDGQLVSKQQADAAERAVDDEKEAAARAGKTLRPNGVRAAAAHVGVEIVMKQKGVVKDTSVGKKKKRRRDGSDPEDSRGGDFSSLEEKKHRLARDASGRFAPKEDEKRVNVPSPALRFSKSWSHSTPATTPGRVPPQAPPALRRKPARQLMSSEDTQPGAPRGDIDSNLQTARALSVSLRVTMPPDVADLIMKEAGLPSPPARFPDAQIPTLKEHTSQLPRNGSSFVLSGFLGIGNYENGVEHGVGLASMNSGDWGAMLGGDVESVTAMMESESAAMAEERHANTVDSFKLAIARVAPTNAVSAAR